MAMNSFKKMIMMANQAPKKQNRVFWNQMIIEDFAYWNKIKVTTEDNDEYITIYPTTTEYSANHISCALNASIGHKLMLTCEVMGDVFGYWVSSTSPFFIHNSEFNIFTKIAEYSGYGYLRIYLDSKKYPDGSFSIKKKSVRIHDLTLMFGAGNEPASVEEFYQRIKGIPVDIYAYNEGEWIEWDTVINPADYLTFEALNDGVKLLYTKGTNTFKCSTDLGLTWRDWTPETYSPVLNAGDKLLVKCVNPTINSTYGIGTIGNDEAGGPKYKVSGDIMSMIFGDDAAFNYSLAGYTRCFSGMLYSRNLVDAGDLILKATELAPYCYNQLLYGCNNNTRLPKELPAEIIKDNCYRYFSNGGYYTEIPAVKAKSATNYGMYGFVTGSKYITKADLSNIKEISGNRPLDAAFKNCSSLNFIKIGWKQWANPSSLSQSWVEGVASQGTFVMPYNIEFDPESIRGTHGIPEGWELKYYDPDNIDDVRDNKEDFYPQERGR